MYSASKDEYVWPEKGDEIYYLVENIACKSKSPVTIRNGLHDRFVIPKYMAICYIILTDFFLLNVSYLTFEKLET